MAVATGLALGAIAGQALAREAIDWQPVLAWREPWRSLTAIGVHYSGLHLAGNLAGAALAGLLGWAAQLPGRAALAWLIAWPLTQVGLLLRPDLLHYGGLSGVLHAGVAIVAVWLLATGATRAQRGVGLAIGVGLVVKVVSESPWGPPLRQPPDWDIQTAPFAHLSGMLAGALAAVGASWMRSAVAEGDESAVGRAVETIQDGTDRSRRREP